jgi:hypothetical protein
MKVPVAVAIGSSSLVVVGDAADERDVAGDLVAVGVDHDVAARGAELDVVNAEVERGDRHAPRQGLEHGGAAGGVHGRGDRPAVQHAGLGVADQLVGVRQADPRVRSLEREDLEPERPVVRDELLELAVEVRERLEGFVGCVGHARSGLEDHVELELGV